MSRITETRVQRLTVSFLLAIISLPFFAMLWLGQIQVFSILGTLLGHCAITRRSIGQLALALSFMLIKPQETWIIFCLRLIGSAWQCSGRDWVKSIRIDLIFSFVAFITLLMQMNLFKPRQSVAAL